MTVILLCCIGLILAVGGLYLVLCREALVASWWYRLRSDPEPWLTEVEEAALGQYGDPYPPEAAEAPYDREPRCGLDPLDEHFNTTPGRPVYVKSDHPEDCAKQCCWDIRLNELVADFDWDAREHEMRSKR